MAKKILWILFIVLAIAIGLYPALYFFTGQHEGLLSSKSAALLSNTLWNIGFYTHISLGGIALLTGWPQLSSKLRNKNLRLHRQLGKIYVVAVIFSSLAAICIGFFATGGIIPAAGFICLGITWFYCTLKAYVHIRNKQVAEHQRMMLYSYAACFAAVTLRIWLPLLMMMFGDFIVAYSVVAWLCWVPNMIVARLITKRLVAQQLT